MKILLVEDEELYVDEVEMLLDMLGYDLVGVFDRSDHVLSAVEEHQPDVVLMDVHIRGNYDGIEVAQMILDQYQVPIIFITSLKDDMTFRRASRVGATNFIIKPFDSTQLKRAIQLAIPHVEKKPNDQAPQTAHFFARRNDDLEKVVFSDIIYIKADVPYCDLYTADKKYVIESSLVKFMEQLPEGDFLQVHRAYVVNIDKVQSINIKENTLNMGNAVIPISRRNMPIVLEKLGAG